jgi:putative membrane protein
MFILWLKAFHLIAVVAWFSGLFYLPRLFVYHCEISNKDLVSYTRFCTMECKLYNYIMTPAAIVTTLLGLYLLYSYAFITYKTAGWLHIKLSLVVLLWVYHIYCGVIMARFKSQQNTYSAKFYRYYNEIPTLFLIAIVSLTIVKPF